MSGPACDKAASELDKLFEQLCLMPPDIGPMASKGKQRAQTEETTERDVGDNEEWPWDCTEEFYSPNDGGRCSGNVSDLMSREEGETTVGRHDQVGGTQSKGKIVVAGRLMVEPCKDTSRTAKDGGKAAEKYHGQDFGTTDDTGVGAATADISREPPPRAKPKGRKLTDTEKQEVTLGAKGEKKGTRRCQECKMLATHNSRTCPSLPHNQQRLEALRNKKGPGRPPGSKNNSKRAGEDEETDGGKKRARTRQKETPVNFYTELECESEEDDRMEVDD
ncbi:unnamed protein product [Urochloa humidicola]